MGLNEKMIQVNNLSKCFGSVKAVENISFQVKRGELFAFLGVNGAGKSTTISMICGQNTADCGSICVNGMDTHKSTRKVKESIGVVFQDSALDKPLTGRENLKSRAALYGITGKAFDIHYGVCRKERICRSWSCKRKLHRRHLEQRVR